MYGVERGQFWLVWLDLKLIRWGVALGEVT